MIQMLIHRMVHSVINLMEQTQVTDLPFVPQTTKLTLIQPFHTANNIIQQTQMRLRQRHPHGSPESWAKFVHAKFQQCNFNNKET